MTRQALKKDICQYFSSQGESRDALKKICALIKDDAERGSSFLVKEDIERRKLRILDFVGDRHHAQCRDFVQRCEAILEEEGEKILNEMGQKAPEDRIMHDSRVIYDGGECGFGY